MANPISKIFKTINFLRTHPFSKRHPVRAIRRFFAWQVRSTMISKPLLYQWTPKAKLWLKKGLRGATGNYYCGFHEFRDMAFILHCLRQTDLFVDVGANIGSYTILASAHVGAESISFEPVPSSFSWLRKNIESNNIPHLATSFKTAVGCRTGILHFTSELGAMNHSLNKPSGNSIEVNVDTLDRLLDGKIPRVIKIDVEGAEASVLSGAKKTLMCFDVKALIIEMGNNTIPIADGISIHDWFTELGFKPYDYDPFTRKLTSGYNSQINNKLYLRDIIWVEERITSAPAFTLWGESI